MPIKRLFTRECLFALQAPSVCCIARPGDSGIAGGGSLKGHRGEHAYLSGPHILRQAHFKRLSLFCTSLPAQEPVLEAQGRTCSPMFAQIACDATLRPSSVTSLTARFRNLQEPGGTGHLCLSHFKSWVFCMASTESRTQWPPWAFGLRCVERNQEQLQPLGATPCHATPADGKVFLGMRPRS